MSAEFPKNVIGKENLKGPLADSVEEGDMAPKEIERKFLLTTLPEDLESYPHKETIQGYVAIAPDGTEVRLRQQEDTYFQTIKSGTGKVRNEYEIEISKDQFDSLWQATAGKRLEKTRYYIPHEGATIELDIFHGDLQGHMTAEVEFPSDAVSEKFNAPAWFGQEVTDDKRYKNQSLALNGLLMEDTMTQK